MSDFALAIGSALWLGILGGYLLGVGRLPVPWQALLLSIGIYVALLLVAGYLLRRWIIAAKGEVILSNPVTILWIAIPLLLQTVSHSRQALGGDRGTPGVAA